MYTLGFVQVVGFLGSFFEGGLRCVRLCVRYVRGCCVGDGTVKGLRLS